MGDEEVADNIVDLDFRVTEDNPGVEDLGFMEVEDGPMDPYGLWRFVIHDDDQDVSFY